MGASSLVKCLRGRVVIEDGRDAKWVEVSYAGRIASAIGTEGRKTKRRTGRRRKGWRRSVSRERGVTE